MSVAARAKSRYIIVLALGFVLGSVLMSPVTAHVGAQFGHLWRDHIKPRLSADGTINSAGNPVDWGQLKDVPSGFADGVDAAQGDGDGGKRTILAPHVFETKGIVGSDPNATDFGIKAVYRRGVVAGCGGGNYCPGGAVSLYLYDESGRPMTGGDASAGTASVVCNPCTRDLGMSTRTVTFSLQDLITDAGGFDSNVKLGFGVIVVSGQDPEGINVVITVKHTQDTYSFPPLEEVSTDEVPSR